MRARHALPSALLVAALLAGVAARADVGAWSPLGPDGGKIQAVAVDSADENVLYAGADGGLFRSTDGGDSWSSANLPLGAFTFVRTIVARSGTVFVGTQSNGAWKSTDGGRSWRSINTGLSADGSTSGVEVLLADPLRRERLWAGTSAGVFVSSDAGETWSNRTADLPQETVGGLAIDPQTGQLYASVGWLKLFTSTDDGTSWEELGCRFCRPAVVDPQRAGTVYTSSGSLLRSRDGGATWRRLPLPKGASGLFPIGTAGDRLFAVSVVYPRNSNEVHRLYWSADAGDHWTPAAAGPADPTIAAFAAGGELLLLGCLGEGGRGGPGGVFRSRDRGEHWEAARSGLAARWINAIAVDPQQPGVLYAKAADHLFASRDGGISWELSLYFGFAESYGGEELVVDPAAADRVWLASLYLLRGDGGGARWTMARGVLGMFAVAPDGRGGVWAGGYGGFYHSTNGKTFKLQRPAGESVGIDHLAVDPRDPNIVWASAYSFTGGGWRLYRTGDGGLTWERRDEGLEVALAGSMVLDPGDPDTVYVTGGATIYRSRDAGAHWQSLATPLPAEDPANTGWALVAAPTTPGRIYAHRTYPPLDGVFRSSDQGATWQRLPNPPAGVVSLAIDPHDPRRLLAGTDTRGVWTITDP